MRRLLLGIVLVTASASACSVNTVEKGGSSGSPDPSGSGSTAAGDGGVSSGGDGSATDGTRPPASTVEAPIDIDGTCPAFSACGGDPQGTFDYTGGCIDDVFANLRQSCPALDTSKLDVTVKGSITFAGKALTRDVTVKMTGDIVFPEICTMGQCALLEGQLKGVFDSVSCTGSAACTCTVANDERDADATTYSISGSTLTTTDGDTYEICEQGGELSYRGKGAGAEEGAFRLKRR